MPPLLPGAPKREYEFAPGLVWGLRGLAFIAVFWGLNYIGDATDAKRTADKLAKQLREDRAGTPGGWQQEAAALESAGSTGVFSAVVIVVGVVVVLLSLAEVLRLCIQIERNARHARE